MRKRPGGWLLTGAMAATAAVALGLGVTPSLASTATTWTVKPGGKFFGNEHQQDHRQGYHDRGGNLV
jgi:hypothetical protein